MAILGNIYHDFPRLAKQSGFYFQLHKGRVNWAELENLNIDEIIENRNFELLEQNLFNVINCDLEREYDLKILDQNFVKLFKLAQLGVDYLSYCEMYLDRCVVLLQEQLTTFQQEYECLKQENQKKKEEVKKSTRKTRTQSYQCEKCEKVFISDVYLKFHDKRRHSNPSTPHSLDGLQKKDVTDSSQQTENGRMLSMSTQTLFHKETAAHSEDNETPGSIKMQHIIKMEKLEQELQELKERLRAAESSLMKKNEASKSDTFQVPSSMYCNPMLMLLPSYLKHSDNGFFEINPGCQVSLPVNEIQQHKSSPLIPTTNSEKLETKSPSNKTPPKENFCHLNVEPEKVSERQREVSSELQKSSVIETLENYHGEEKEDFEHDKENVDPKDKKIVSNNLPPPLPPPRRLKREIPVPAITETKLLETEFARKEVHSEEEIGFQTPSAINRSTPVKDGQDEGFISEIFEASQENLSEINKPEAILSLPLSEDLKSKKGILREEGSKSIIKKIIKGNSPKLETFSKNIKRSLTNLYDTISSSEKDLRSKGSKDKNLRTTVVDSLNYRLKQLGVDPEWSGIPKKTMKQKLNALKHRRRHLSKENPAYPAVRQSLEEKIFQKLKKNLSSKKTTFVRKFNKSESMNTGSPEILNTQDELVNIKTEFIKVKNCPMYDIDSDSESKASDSENNFLQVGEQSTSRKNVIIEEFSSDLEEKVDIQKDREFDLSVFQVGGGNVEKVNTKNCNTFVKEGELMTDSDDESNTDNKTVKTLKSFLSFKSAAENSNPIEDGNKEHLGKATSENQSILKDREGFQSKISVNPKKKVLFANYSSVLDDELSDSPLDDDLWSFKSDWEKDTG